MLLILPQMCLLLGFSPKLVKQARTKSGQQHEMQSNMPGKSGESDSKGLRLDCAS